MLLRLPKPKPDADLEIKRVRVAIEYVGLAATDWHDLEPNEFREKYPRLARREKG